MVHFAWGAALEALTGAAIVALGPVGYVLQFIKLGAKATALTACEDYTFVQYEVSPKRHLETPSGDELPDLEGPGKGDIYYGEGWTLGLQTKYRLGIEFDTETETWELTIYTDQSNIPMILSWERTIDQVPDDIMLTIRRMGEEWQDMREIRKVELTSGSRITEERFEICAQRLAKAQSSTNETRLLPCYPNPTPNGEVWIPYELGEETEVEIKIYDIAGELVRTFTPTNNPAYWDGLNQKGKKVASGIYIYLFKAGSYTATGKMAICR